MASSVNKFIQHYFWWLHAGASGVILLTAFAFQYLGGLSPCTLCIWQRWPYVAAIIVALFIRNKWLLALCYLVGFGLAFFHVGVELHWWPGLASCGSTIKAGEDIASILAAIEKTPVTKCDEVTWRLLGVSMAGWNGVLSFVLIFTILLASNKSRIISK